MPHNRITIRVVFLILVFLALQIPLVSSAQDDSSITTNSDAQENNESSDNIGVNEINYVFDWTTFILTTDVHIRWIPNSEEQFINPNQAYDISQSVLPTAFTEITKSIFVKEQHTLLDYTRDHSSYKLILSQMLGNTYLESEIPDRDLAGSTFIYKSPLTGLFVQTVSLSYPQQGYEYFPSAKAKEKDYTSIIFAVDKPISLISNATIKLDYTQKIIPIVHSSDLTYIAYSSEYFQYNVSTTKRPYSYITAESYPSTDTGSIPLFITPIFLTQEKGGDLVINEKDTEYLLSSPEIRTLVKEGKVFFLIASDNKKTSLIK